MAKILVVDDNPEIRMVYVRTLQKWGYDAIEASDGADVQQWVEDTHPDVIILDLMMPGVDGWQCLKLLKANSESRDIPVIISSAMDDSETLAKARTLGAFDFVPKPWSAGELKRRIDWAVAVEDSDMRMGA